MTDPSFHDGVLAEQAAQSMAIMKALAGLAALSGNPEQYKRTLLEAGLRDLPKTDYFSVPPERKEAFLAQAEARYTALIAGIR